MKIKSNKQDADSLADLKSEHIKSLIAPLDAYWEEALIGYSDHYETIIDGVRAGFYCLDGENQLLAFYLSPQFESRGAEALGHLINEHSVKTALAGTNDPFFLYLCSDIATRSNVHTLLFQDDKAVSIELAGFENLEFEIAGDKDFEDVFRHYAAASGSFDEGSVETGYEDIKGYVRSVMTDHQIFVLRSNSKIIATGECRISKTQRPHADVGMIVASEQRRKGVGSYMLNLTKEYCYEKDSKPICSCEAGNIGSKKAIMNAGFISQHQVFEIELKR